MKQIALEYQDISQRRPCFRVYERADDATLRLLGEIEYKRFPHIRQSAWEATAADGHRAVHQERWQAALALAWDGNGYPFPMRRPSWLKD